MAHALDEYDLVRRKSIAHDAALAAALQTAGGAVGQQYASLGSLAYRQTLAALKPVWDDARGEEWVFLKVRRRDAHGGGRTRGPCFVPSSRPARGLSFSGDLDQRRHEHYGRHIPGQPNAALHQPAPPRALAATRVRWRQPTPP